MTIMNGSVSRQVSFWLDTATADKLARVAYLEGTSQSAIIREALAVRLASDDEEKDPLEKVDEAIRALENMKELLVDYKQSSTQPDPDQAPPPVWA